MHSFQLHKSYTGAAYYQHELLSSDMLIHGFFTSKGGVSKGVFSGLNSALNSGDQISDVNKNRQIVTQSMTHNKYQLITLNQIHGNRVITIDSFDSGRSLDNRQPVSGLQADGLVTKRKDVLLGILTADCAPILMADNKAGVIGACHAGWRGAASGIIENTLLAMCKIGAKRQDICCIVGPAIAQKNYQVGPDLRNSVLEKYPSAFELFAPDTQGSMISGENKFLFDLQGFCLTVLEHATIKNHAIINVDTYQNKDLLYSYRLSCHIQEQQYGRQISVIGLR